MTRTELLRKSALSASRWTASARRVWLAQLGDEDLEEVVSLVETESALSALSTLARQEQSERREGAWSWIGTSNWSEC